MASGGGIVKSLGQRVWTRFMDKVGSRIVSRMADTSSDAPNAFHKPKRDIYRQMEEEKAQRRAQRAAGEDGHDHGHDHDHGRK